MELSEEENDVAKRFQAGIPVVAIGGTGTGIVQGLTRTGSGLLRVLVKWNGSGITAETYPSQIKRKGWAVKISDAPRRVQLQRAKGWRMPDNTVKVDRGTAFGNPFKADAGRGETPEQMVRLFVSWFQGDSHMLAKYPDLELRRRELLRRLPALRGKNLACWCKIGTPCHADELIKLANQEK